MNKENEAIIKALNMYGRVPKQWELLNEIERLNKQIEEYQKALDETTSEKIDLQSIIKEVREEIRILESNCDISDYQAQKLYQKLDMVNI